VLKLVLEGSNRHNVSVAERKVSHHVLAHYTKPKSGVCIEGCASLVILSLDSAFPLMISMYNKCLFYFGSMLRTNPE
jgi:hypothetical protein